jgi:LPXTG-motif cell wall-anchored protein
MQFVLYLVMFVAVAGGFVVVRRKRKAQTSAAN